MRALLLFLLICAVSARNISPPPATTTTSRTTIDPDLVTRGPLRSEGVWRNFFETVDMPIFMPDSEVITGSFVDNLAEEENADASMKVFPVVDSIDPRAWPSIAYSGGVRMPSNINLSSAPIQAGNFAVPTTKAPGVKVEEKPRPVEEGGEAKLVTEVYAGLKVHRSASSPAPAQHAKAEELKQAPNRTVIAQERKVLVSLPNQAQVAGLEVEEESAAEEETLPEPIVKLLNSAASIAPGGRTPVVVTPTITVKTTTVAAVVLEPSQKVTPATVVLETKTKNATLETVVVEPKGKNATPEVVLVETKGKNVTPETVVVETEGKNVTPETVILETKGKNVTPEVVLVETKGKNVTPETVVIETEGKNVTPETVILETKSKNGTAKTVVIESVIQNGTPATILLDVPTTTIETVAASVSTVMFSVSLLICSVFVTHY